jgi:hypothetical protein
VKVITCPWCWGTGIIWVRGARVREEDLPPEDQAELMVLGGFAYESVARPCARCSPSTRVVARQARVKEDRGMSILTRLLSIFRSRRTRPTTRPTRRL